MLSEEDGKFLLKLARKAIETYLNEGKILEVPSDTPETVKKLQGAFVTLSEHGNLRGCIGYCEPFKPLVNTIIEVAISAATSDPRFNSVEKSELPDIDLEISVLTKPQLVEVKTSSEYLEKIEVGKDGLIIEKDFYKGILLPQVPVEWKWNAEEFLCNTCIKAGLAPDCWHDTKTKIFSFQAQIFYEK
ncbi:TIGR00296 family protein [Methanobacterium alcaliphilum]|uniref:TIGR00296 family protein n=1 Tax=Methanobacterium alcaliphilum TaxID=392018 RepID=UPI00200A1427|nr:TIGR00296 family protein [Methanobacterium alcaliphilum]MCK9150921.1 TIGR00296 family protein [Methanobacterium alcaliphilum]